MLAWFRRIVVSLGVGGTSYALMLAFMVASIAYDRELEPVVTFAFNTGRQITDLLKLMGIRKLLGPGCGQPSSRTGEHDPCRAFNSGNRHGRHIGRHSFKSDFGWHPKLVPTPCHCDCEYTSYSYPRRDVVHLQRACPGNVCSAVALRGSIWQASLNALSVWGDSIPGARKLTNVARQGFSGHHFVIMALCSAIAAFLVNALFASAGRSKEPH